MTTKKYLSQVRLFDREINRKIERLGDLYAEVTRVTALYREAPGGGNSNRSFEERMGRYLALLDEINADIDRLTDLKQEIRTLIDTLPDEIRRTVLEMHYLRGMTFEEIGDAVGYSPRHIRRIEKQALAVLEPTAVS